MFHKLPSDKDRSLNSKGSKAMPEWTDVLLSGKVADQLGIFLFELRWTPSIVF